MLYVPLIKIERAARIYHSYNVNNPRQQTYIRHHKGQSYLSAIQTSGRWWLPRQVSCLTLKMEAICSSETSSLSKLHGVTAQKTVFIMMMEPRMSAAYTTHRRQKMLTKFGLQNRKKRAHFQDVDVDGSIILKRTSHPLILPRCN
jgi:hypothetical protein